MSALLKAVGTRIYMQHQVDKSVETLGEVQDVYFPLDMVNQPMQEHILLHLFVPSALCRQRPELDGVVSYHMITLS